MSNTIILVHDASQIYLGRRRCPDALRLRGAIEGYRDYSDPSYMEWFFSHNRDIILTQFEFCNILNQSNNPDCDYKRYLAKYELVIPTPIDLVERIKISTHDIAVLKKFCDYNPALKKYTWKEEFADYEGVFSREKDFALHGTLYYIDRKFYGIIPREPFQLFESIEVNPYNYLLINLLKLWGISYSLLPAVPDLDYHLINLHHNFPKDIPIYNYKFSFGDNLVISYLELENDLIINRDTIVICDFHNWCLNNGLCKHRRIDVDISDVVQYKIISNFLDHY